MGRHATVWEQDICYIGWWVGTWVKCLRSILAKKSRHMEHIISEKTETEIHPDNMNREDKFIAE
jgi:hypothetical protein